MKIYDLKITYQEVSRCKSDLVETPQDVVRYMRDAFNDRPMQEALFVVPVNTKNRALGRYMVTLGIVDESLLHCREIFQPVILSGATSFILCHNHPSGDPSPSQADINTTLEMKEAGRIMNIKMLDHVIIGSKEADPNTKGYYSLSEAGYICTSPVLN